MSTNIKQKCLVCNNVISSKSDLIYCEECGVKYPKDGKLPLATELDGTCCTERPLCTAVTLLNSNAKVLHCCECGKLYAK